MTQLLYSLNNNYCNFSFIKRSVNLFTRELTLRISPLISHFLIKFSHSEWANLGKMRKKIIFTPLNLITYKFDQIFIYTI